MKAPDGEPGTGLSVSTFYRFVTLTDPQGLQLRVRALAEACQLRGTVLLAHEGINGTVTGTATALDTFERDLPREAPLAGLRFKRSTAKRGNPVFLRLKVMVKAEIVTLGQPGLDPAQQTGEHVDAQQWNALLDDPAVRVIDTRNHYETAIGTFPEAEDPGTENFREFPAYVDEQLGKLDRSQPVAMFCTGGIRCEKASAYLLQQGFERVYQLRGGILEYLETVAPEANRWRGECFVFDSRVSVTDELGQGAFDQCHACRHPLSDADRASEHYQAGVSCPHCVQRYEPCDRQRFAERARQVALADRRGVPHRGPEAAPSDSSGSR